MPERIGHTPDADSKLDSTIPLEQAQELFGDYFYGPDEVEKALCIKIDREKIPPIPFSQEDLTHSQELGQKLILRIAETESGDAITVSSLGVFFDENKSRSPIFAMTRRSNENYWCRDDEFYVDEAPRVGWALVADNVTRWTRNYTDQTDGIIDYLKEKVFEGELPSDYAEAVDEYEDKKNELVSAVRFSAIDRLSEISRGLVQLKITELTRPTAVEAVYDLIVGFDRSAGRFQLNKNLYLSTSSVGRSGYMIAVEKANFTMLPMPPTADLSKADTYFSRRS